MVKSKRKIGPLLIILAGCFWGSMGIFVRKLASYGFTSVQIVSIRVTLAALISPACCWPGTIPVSESPCGIFPCFWGWGLGVSCFLPSVTLLPSP